MHECIRVDTFTQASHLKHS